ncbi:hypothetical protein DER45DRAFT_535919 [Fusarium avenaceum]|nr:hypothetical protein DER45DRAFT_535919 [Fusarium avenaceum]
MAKIFRYLHMPFLHFDPMKDGSFYGPVNAFLNKSDPQERDDLTRAWLDNMKGQLKVVIITSSLISSIISSSFSWPVFGTELHNFRSILLQFVKVYWYSALALLISSVASSSQHYGLFIYFTGLYVLGIIEISLYIEQVGGLKLEFGIYLGIYSFGVIMAISNYILISISTHYRLKVAKDSLIVSLAIVPAGPGAELELGLVRTVQ